MLDAVEKEVCNVCNSLLEAKPRIRMLEAGCGSASRLRLKPAVDAVGIDISRAQLDRNTAVQEKILGDIQDYPLPRNEFDVAVCWWVMEHLPRPKDALANLFGSVEPGGLVILAFPNLLSLKAMITKITPFWFHKLYYQAMKWRSHPFPTYLHSAIMPANVIRFAQENGLAPVFFKLAEGDTIIKRVRTSSRFVDWAVSALTWTVKTISFGKLDSLMLDCCAIVLRKQSMSSLTYCLDQGVATTDLLPVTTSQGEAL